MSKPQHSERGRMAIGLSQVIRARKSDVDRPPRWNYTTLVDVSRPEPRVYKVAYLTSPGIERVEYLSTNQMCIAELQALREFASNGKSDDEPQFLPQVDEPEEDPIHESAAEPATEPAEDPKPKANGNVRITGYEMLERKIRAVEPPISEAIRDTSVVAPETKYRTMCVVKTYTVVREEVFLVPFTEKTLSEFQDMGNGNDDDRFVYNYLLRRQTDKLAPISARSVSESTPTFVIKEKGE